ncbi:hypothetical protein HYALB_00004303 [Hymenoscyphus albidus]|uniref:DUF8004 domain-containing protein n=1 Tax=Hymenoscyphus albidus TaxID=595503 RepID=A0A9N9M191_9HELO|nr:hypothetical protein HYALB_00004303 [Hymenoscyphus albidus]
MVARKVELERIFIPSHRQSLSHTYSTSQEHTGNSYSPQSRSPVKGMNVRKWNGAARCSTEWDELRRDSALWFKNGDCHVHLHAKGQSQRPPTFRVPINALVAAKAQPLLERCLIESVEEATGSNEDINNKVSWLDLYITTPSNIERGQIFLHHTSTRNFFAWVFRRSLVGIHLGGALVGLLNTMNEFRSAGEDNFQALFNYMEEEGYLDMRNSPDHALGILFFAEHFRLEQTWLDAFVHCVGMYESLPTSAGFEHISPTSRALLTRSFTEMDARLGSCSQKLRTFLSDELSDAYFGMPQNAKHHLDKFRAFLHTFYIAKLGHYPPTVESKTGRFPKSILNQMATDFKKLYEFLVDTSFTSYNLDPATQHAGICVMHNVQAFDRLYNHSPLEHPIPLLPQSEEYKKPKGKFRGRLSLQNTKGLPDRRLVTCASLLKATNWESSNPYEGALVMAFRSFERDFVFSVPTSKHETLQQANARTIRWLLIYSIHQTLKSATAIPDHVSDTQNVQYNLCAMTPDLPPWKQSPSCDIIYRLPTGQITQDHKESLRAKVKVNRASAFELKRDIEYQAIQRRPQFSLLRGQNTETLSRRNSLGPQRGMIRRALNSLGNMPELQHPTPHRLSYHEILVYGYGNGTHDVTVTDGPAATTQEDDALQRKVSAGSQLTPSEKSPSLWSHTSEENDETRSSNDSKRSTSGSTFTSINEFLDNKRGTSVLGLPEKPSSAYSASIYEDDDDDKKAMEPAPLHVREVIPDKDKDPEVPNIIENLQNLGVNRELEEF